MAHLENTSFAGRTTAQALLGLTPTQQASVLSYVRNLNGVGDTNRDQALPFGEVGAAVSAGRGAIATANYVFSTTTTDSDPGSGNVRFNQSTQNASTVLRFDLLDWVGQDVTSQLAMIAAVTGPVKGYIRLYKATDPTKWLVFRVSALATPSGYRNVSVTATAWSAASPFSNGDALTMVFSPTGGVGPVGGHFLSTSDWIGNAGDSDVSFGGTVDGTDYATQLQALITYAASIRAIVYWDGNYAVSVPLSLPDDTFILAVPGCGVIRKDGTRRPIFINSSRSHTGGTYTNKNIVLANITVNGNAYGLTDGTSKLDSGTEYGADNGSVWLQDLWFSGVDEVRLYNTRHYKSRTFATFMSNCRNAVERDTVVDQGDAFTEANHDGHHHTGPMNGLIVSGCKIRSYDDAVALNADEGGGAAASPTLGGAQWGPITNWKIENLTLDNGSRGGSYGKQGIRLLSSATSAPIEQGKISGVYGDTTLEVISANNFPINNLGPGAFGDVVIENIDCNFHNNAGLGGEFGTAYMDFGGFWRSLTLRGVKRHESINNSINTVYFGNYFYSPCVTIEDFKFADEVTGESVSQIVFAGQAELVRLRDVANYRDQAFGALAHLFDLSCASPLRGIGRLEFDGVMLTDFAVGVYHSGGFLGELVVHNTRMENDGGYGLYYPDTGMTCGLYGAGDDVNVPRLVAPQAPGTVGTKYGSGWDTNGSPAGAKFVAGKATPFIVFDADAAVYSDVACTTAQTSDAGNVKGCLDYRTGRGRLASQAAPNNPVLKKNIYATSHSVIRFTGATPTRLDHAGVYSPSFSLLFLVIPRSVANVGQNWASQVDTPGNKGWQFGHNDADGTKIQFAVLRNVGAGETIILNSSTAALASGTLTIVGATFDNSTHVAKLYQWDGASTMTLLDTDTLAAGPIDLATTLGCLGSGRSAPSYFWPATADIGWAAFYDTPLTATMLNSALADLKTLKGL